MNKDINIEEFIRINDEVLCADKEYYGYSWCGVCPDAIDEICINRYDTVSIHYQVPYEDYFDTWTLPKIYFSMTDEEILAHAKAEYERKEAEESEQEYKRDMLKLKELSAKLGYELIKKGE